MNIGEKLKDLRIQNGLTQQELADRSELTKGFISQVERNQTSISIATLVDVLECLGTNLQEFFSETVEEKILFTKEDYFESVDENRGFTINWLVPNSQKNQMEPILMKLEPQSVTAEDMPHPGEEFGYVLSGSIVIHLGKRKIKAKAGESFYYTADVIHYISNPGKTVAQILWVSTPPSF